MGNQLKEPTNATSNDYGALKVSVLSEAPREVNVEVVNENLSGMGFRCLNGKPPKQGDEIQISRSNFRVLWTKVQNGDTLFGVMC